MKEIDFFIRYVAIAEIGQKALKGYNRLIRKEFRIIGLFQANTVADDIFVGQLVQRSASV
jgi:hypothetical protein